MVDMNDKFLDAKKLFQNMFQNVKQIKTKIKIKKKTTRLLWNSTENGTYIKSKHGELK